MQKYYFYDFLFDFCCFPLLNSSNPNILYSVLFFGCKCYFAFSVPSTLQYNAAKFFCFLTGEPMQKRSAKSTFVFQIIVKKLKLLVFPFSILKPVCTGHWKPRFSPKLPLLCHVSLLVFTIYLLVSC